MKIRTSVICSVLILGCCAIILGRLDALTVNNDQGRAAKVKAIIVIDAGHGGNDPGKIGVNGAKEKDINLNIAMFLEQYLTAQDIQVTMTRTSDTGLYSEGTSNKKAEDMRNRVKLVNDSQADLLVSIHQNSYTAAKYTGAQVFYYKGSLEGRRLAESIQNRLVSGLDPDNHRAAKDNSEYYLLKNAPAAAVICECGFLSNPEECEKLSDENYQRQVAWNIYMGIMNYLNGRV